jgi:iron(III)-salmochelin esterase
MQAVVLVPARRAAERFPVLIAFHGQAEAHKGIARGALGWIDDYWMPRALERLRDPPLTRDDFQGMVSAARLANINASLKKQPYQGLIIVCPYTPDIYEHHQPLSAALPVAKFVVEDLLPRVYKQTPAIGTPATTGVDGVSLGGRTSILVGFDDPQAFGVVASLQAAFDSADAPALAKLAEQARQQNPKLRIRLLTSDRDAFLGSNRAIARALSAEGVPNELTIVTGTHSYAFNRGAGVYEMLLFHDRALRGEPTL